MSISISLDKSTFQSLSHDEVVQLHKYYIVNITPLLVSEILGDLSKEEDERKKLPKDVVAGLANKIFPAGTYINVNYKKLLELSLLGLYSNFDNRPFLEATKSVNGAGRSGLVFEETEDEKSIRRWKDGDFSSTDQIASMFWRSNTNADDVIEKFKNSMIFFSHIKLENKKGDTISNLQELKDILLSELNEPRNQPKLLSLIIDYYGIPSGLASQIFYRWESEGFNSLNEFSPYAFFCLSVVAMYYIGINNTMMGNRKTNLLDLEYLYYTPCSRVFSTNDKFLVSLFTLINPSKVYFISTQMLKDDLRKFHEYQSVTGDNSRRPPIKDTKTFRIWDEVLDLKLDDSLKTGSKSQEELIAEFEEILKTSKSGNEVEFVGEPDFVTKKFRMRPSDPCMCGSGKPLKDCHLVNNTHG